MKGDTENAYPGRSIGFYKTQKQPIKEALPAVCRCLQAWKTIIKTVEMEKFTMVKGEDIHWLS